MESANKDPKEETKDVDRQRGPVTNIADALNSLKNPNVLNKITSILSLNEVQMKSAVLRLDIEEQEENTIIELDENDVAEVFSKFGTVESVHILPSQKFTALVTMADYVAAYLAQQMLDEEYLPETRAKMFVKWNSDRTSASDLPSHQSNLISIVGSASGHPQPKTEQGESSKNAFVAENVYQELGKINRDTPNARYNCKFHILIGSDKEFQAVRKLSGAKSCNLRRIVDLCSKGSKQEVIRLTLRGQGTELSEWKDKFENSLEEPLSLCISSRYYDKYLLAKHLAKELILNVYEDYKRYCDRNGKRPLDILHLKTTENVFGIKSADDVQLKTHDK
eukprot:TRINITY_DN3508_c0_g1_i3.p1 TRINITY_DN3508_c0_g1~~TRINITY_DN3508_c0_g1_i3.p1  ORF type:complete len:336 (-),score=62.71 TRINITY_DN3508_c0_g1_i3:166-1173(-)